MKVLVIFLLFLASFFAVFPEVANAQTSSSSASCSLLDVGCQVCWLFCFPSTWAEDQFHTLDALKDDKAPFAYFDAIFQPPPTTQFAISEVEPILGPGYKLHMVNEPADAAVTQCSVYQNGSNVGTSAHITGDPDAICQVYWPLDSVHDELYVTLESSTSAILHTTATWPETSGTTGSDEILPLTITLASVSAIPAIGMAAQAGATYTASDDDHWIKNFLATYVRPFTTLFLWLLLIGYFIGVKDRIFT